MQRNLLKRVNAQNLQSSVEASRQFEFLVPDRFEQIGRHRDPDLRFHSIRTRAEVMLEAKVSLDPEIFGFLAKLLLLLIPLGVFIIKLKHTGSDDYALNVIGICFVVAFMIFGITQGPFAYKFICSFYGFVIAGLNAQIFSNQEEKNSLGSPATSNDKRGLAA